MKNQSTYALKLRCDSRTGECSKTYIVNSGDIVPGQKPLCPSCGSPASTILDVLEPSQEDSEPDGYSVGVTETFEHVTLNLPPDELTPNGATLLLTTQQAGHLIGLLLQAVNIIEQQEKSRG